MGLDRLWGETPVGRMWTSSFGITYDDTFNLRGLFGVDEPKRMPRERVPYTLEELWAHWSEDGESF